MDALVKAKDEEIVKLLADNRELSEELRQCQADKEFVWSLWKRLQVSSPDLTQAISLVMQREKEKTEMKDRKVMEILQSKDEQIESLQDMVTSLKKEVDKLVQMKNTLEDTRSMLTTENEELKETNNRINENIAKLEASERDQTAEVKKALENAKEQRDSLNDQVTKLLVDIQQMRVERQSIEMDNEKLTKKSRKLADENEDLSSKYQKLKLERESLSEEVLKLKSELSHYKDGEDTARRELDTKEQSKKEIKEAYEKLKAHSEEQQNVILQLQALNDDSQSVLRDQDKTYKEELNRLQKMYANLQRKYEELQKTHSNVKKAQSDLKERVKAQDEALLETGKELKRSLDLATGGRRRRNSFEDIDDLEFQVSSQQGEIELLRRKLKEKNQKLAQLRADDSYSYDKDYLPEHTFSPIIERGGTRKQKEVQQRSRSLSPPGRQMVLVNRRLQATEEKLESMKRLLELKKDELSEVQQSHDRRLDRLKQVQSNYRELRGDVEGKDALRQHKDRKKTRRTHSKELRQENSDAVWNELALYKRENRNLMQDKLNLEEELDNLRVHASMDKATVQELNMQLKQEKEEMMKLRQNANRLSSTPKKRSSSQDEYSRSNSTTSLRHLVKNLERKLQNSSEDNRQLKQERNQLLKDIRVLKDENKSWKRDIADSRESSTSLRRELVELRRELEKVEDKKMQAELDAQDLNKEMELRRDDISEVRRENNALREENNDLRRELTDMKSDLREITKSLEEAEGLSARSYKTDSQVPSISSGAGSRLNSKSAKKHQKFLNKSINKMRQAFGNELPISEDGYDPTIQSETVTEDSDAQSELSSLGQSIVRVAKSVRRIKGDILDDDDEDTLVEDDMPDLKSHKGKSSARSKTTSRYGLQELTTLRQRLTSMQKQCKVLIQERQAALREASTERENSGLAKAEVQGLQNRLKSSKQSIQKLHREVETISREKEELSRALESLKNSMPETQKYSDTDYRLLENKIRAANSDAHHYMEQMKKHQKENEEKAETMATMKDKIGRLERDVTMKRQLIEEQRAKLKLCEQNNKTDQQAILDLEEQVKATADDVIHKKSYVESLKKQLQAVTRDKARCEQSYNDLQAELEKRREQVSVEQARKLEAEHLASHLESTVEQQLNTLASKSEQALDKLQTQLTVSNDKNREYSTCIQLLSSQLMDLLNQIRSSIYTHKETVRQEALTVRDQDPSMSRAQSIACTILNMSKSDFDDLMTPVDIGKKDEEEKKRADEVRMDQEWKIKVEEIASENPPFAKSLNRLLWDKIQDAVYLAEEKWRIQHETS